MKEKGFLPIIGKNPKILILGSFPGKESLRKNQYYAYSRNTFWYIMSELLNINTNAGYTNKKEILIKNGIAIWDVLKACERKGSLDSSIKDKTIEINNFSNIFVKYPSIDHILFNGIKAESEYKKRVLPLINNEFHSIKYHILPSTSPAMAMLTKEQKIKKWSIILDS